MQQGDSESTWRFERIFPDPTEREIRNRKPIQLTIIRNKWVNSEEERRRARWGRISLLRGEKIDAETAELVEVYEELERRDLATWDRYCERLGIRNGEEVEDTDSEEEDTDTEDTGSEEEDTDTEQEDTQEEEEVECQLLKKRKRDEDDADRDTSRKRKRVPTPGVGRTISGASASVSIPQVDAMTEGHEGPVQGVNP
ncbi:hypothetical protein VNI00_016899 [Paramarasmius palmivorus]|uniref:Uncharacterized protein n=1 Tax=Paramarasmius palmivorus TaxID=297713 RepID=A0AAW0BB80_9AGAR